MSARSTCCSWAVPSLLRTPIATCLHRHRHRHRCHQQTRRRANVPIRSDPHTRQHTSPIVAPCLPACAALPMKTMPETPARRPITSTKIVATVTVTVTVTATVTAIPGSVMATATARCQTESVCTCLGGTARGGSRPASGSARHRRLRGCAYLHRAGPAGVRHTMYY